jgi:galactokinase
MTLEATFARRFGVAPGAVASAPGRVNLLGEHTDYNDGLVLPTAIALSTEVALGSSRDGRFHFISEELPGTSATVDFDDGERPPAGYGRYVHGCVEVLRHSGYLVGPCCIAVRSTVPMGAGLSSSAALEVAVLRGLRLLHGLDYDDVTLARLAQRAEIDYAGVQCGIMDQMTSSIGEPGQLLFLDTRSLESRLLPFPPETEIAVFDSGVSRSLAASGYNERRRECEEAAKALDVASLRDVVEPARVESLPSPLRERARHVVTENSRVLAAVKDGVDARTFGRLMNESHRSLRDDFAVSVPALDALVECVVAQDSVYGCKLTGAGFGGACVALLRAGEGDRVRDAALRAYAQVGHEGRALL